MQEWKTFILKIYRGMPNNQYWEEFELPLDKTLNIVSALMMIQRNPLNRKNEQTTPVVWESGCLEEVCGSCSMLINGKPRQSCTALIEEILKETKSNIITLAPFSKFPLVRDLIVDRSSMFENLKKVHAWIDVDDSRAKESPKISQEKQELMHSLASCMTCGCCLESCPQINSHSPFIGPAAIAQTLLFNIHPIGKFQKSTRLHVMMENGGVGDCGNAQNCVRVCPKNIPLTQAIAEIGRSTTKQAFEDLFGLQGVN